MPGRRLCALGLAAAVATAGVTYALRTYVSALRPPRGPHLPGPRAAAPARGRANASKETGTAGMDRAKMKKDKGKEVEMEKIRETGKEEREKKKEVKEGKKKEGKEKMKKGKEKGNQEVSKKNDKEEKKKEQEETKIEKEAIKENQEKQNSTLTMTLLQPPKQNKQILVLGLDGAGKTSVLHSLAANRVQHSVAPTLGFNAVCISTEDSQMEFLEIGGSEPFRSHWEMYLSKGLLLIFVVDSADHNRLPEAKKYLHQLIEASPDLPLVVFAHKQDLEAAYHITDIHDALALSEVGNDRKLFLFGTQVTKNGSEIPSTLQDAKDLIAHLATSMQ
ncbi:ADP-ribosylation factor-like protein 9 isoform X2 [Castor canadensis]|uniref:ADP-ribosylation factor-like protein 9 isoform X2 n=1 Tax=Castor canadensis TaxID=51338 RepID=A0AC58JX05_CASCN